MIQQFKIQLENNEIYLRICDVDFSAFKQDAISIESKIERMTYGIGIGPEQLNGTLNEFIPGGNVDHGSAAEPKERESLVNFSERAKG